ncbi:MAG TPA: MmcQ/YjbR family DNA-binding protein [Planctomycetota bacterium]|nr:MmcQ/YjbR family DNA-binding protein [Planctomycetota bacterium]
MTFAAVRQLAFALPGVEEGSSYGTPAFKVRGKFLTRLREEDQSLVLTVGSMVERDALLRADPEVFHVTEHYRNYPHVLVRLATVQKDVLARMLTDSWCRVAPRRLLAERD